MGLHYTPRRQRYSAGSGWHDASPAEDQAYRWERRRYELLGHPAGAIQAVAKLLGVSVRTLQRYEFDGAPRWYELALIGLARSKPHQQKRAK